jgi:hypothetical protein
LPEPVASRAVDRTDGRVLVRKRLCRGDPHLPVVTIRVVRKEAA